MKKTSNINIRIDKDVKEKSEQIFESMGINMSIAINLFLNQAIRVNGIPFEIKAPEQKEDEGNRKNSIIKINNEKINCLIDNGLYYFEYNNKKFVIAYESVKADELCIYPNEWKIENKNVLPSAIHYEISDIATYTSKYYNSLVNINEEIIKILVLKNVDKISIHPNYEKKHLLLPENLVNGINVVSLDELDNLIIHYNDFIEIKSYKI